MKVNRIKDSTNCNFRTEKIQVELAHALDINISEVCRNALKNAIGLKIEEKKNDLSPLVKNYLDVFISKHEEEQKNLDRLTDIYHKSVEKQEEQKKVAADKEQFLKEKIIPEIWYRKLPGNDIHGDFAEAWIDYAGRLSRESGLDITVRELQEYVKRANYAGP